MNLGRAVGFGGAAIVLALAAGIFDADRSAAGATAAETSRARAKLQAGAHALDEGEYEEALARFQEAFQIVPSPKIQFNFGLAYKGLARHAEALEAFERFVDEAKDAAPATRGEAAVHIAALRQRVGTLSVSCDTDGAEVRLDGRALGTTPLARPIYVNAGPHQLVVQKGSGTPVVRAFTAEAGARLQLSANLAQAPILVARDVSLAARAPATKPVPPVAIAAKADRDDDASKASSGHGWILWAVAGTLVAAAGVTLAIVLGRSTSYPDTNGPKLMGN